jgi:hypothetical protein
LADKSRRHFKKHKNRSHENTPNNMKKQKEIPLPKVSQSFKIAADDRR